MRRTDGITAGVEDEDGGYKFAADALDALDDGDDGKALTLAMLAVFAELSHIHTELNSFRYQFPNP